MLKTLMQLLGDQAPVFRRYLCMAAIYGVLSGLTITALIPVVSHLLGGETVLAAQWLVALVAGVLLCWALRRRVERAGMGVGVALLQSARHRIGDHVATLPVGWFTPDNTARLSHLISHGMMEVAQLPAHLFTPVIGGLVAPVIMVVALLGLNLQMGLIALAALPVLAAIFVLAARLGRSADEAFQHHSALTSQRMVEFAQAQSVLRAFNGGGASTGFLERAIAQQRDSGSLLMYASALSIVLNAWVVQAVFAALMIAAGLWLGTLSQTGLQQQEVIAVIVSLMLVNRFVDPLLDVAGYGEALRGARGQLDAVRDIFAIAPLPEPAQSRTPQDASVTLREVVFRYAEDQDNVLRGVSLHAAPGTMTALVGSSGSGKTSLMRLIARFFDVSGGSVMIGGVDVRDMSGQQLSAQISQIFQDTYLFQGSIADNIRLGKPGASDEEVMEAARLSGVGEIIERLPQGLATPVGEGGARLSGGERQRISIARALLKDAPILLVDEATAALDAENQAAITETLARLHGKRTLIVIAHQLSTIAMADQIVVLEHGKAAEQGTHAELKARSGLYTHFLQQRHTAKGWRIA
ncbi:ABC transporter ATP-binding protein [Comamonas composti]|uniref:ABC transporter ATP-binding protein n=1 Tax=Comamonas composti TaxID=408558 RepID=UPI000407B9E3|nr:ABC transporter ATP-binding protein [Comamonas composti]